MEPANGGREPPPFEAQSAPGCPGKRRVANPVQSNRRTGFRTCDLQRTNCTPLAGLAKPPYTIDSEVLPPLEQAVAKPRGYKHIAAGLRRLAEWRSFLDFYCSSPPAKQTKLLTHSCWSWERYCPQTEHNPDQGCVSPVCPCPDKENHWLCCSRERPVGYGGNLPPVRSSCWQP